MTTLIHTTTLTANTYRSYLVRFWRSNDRGCWRASAQCVQTGVTVRFGDMESLFTFLHTVTDQEGGEAAKEMTLGVAPGMANAQPDPM
jgi:hypothetical protein